MAGFYGGDTEQMRRHGAASEQGAQRITDITAVIGASIDSVVWQGPDAEAFRTLWHSSVKPKILALAEDVRAAGQEIDQHAEQQEQASGEGAGGGLFGAIAGHLGGIVGPGGMTGPRFGAPLMPSMLSFPKSSAVDEGVRSGQEFYAGEGYLNPGGAAGNDRPLGALHVVDSSRDSVELEANGSSARIESHRETRSSFGTNTTVDEFGNETVTFGARSGTESDTSTRLDSLNGAPGMDASSVLGSEFYGEGGYTTGPDGMAAGLKLGTGVYAEDTTTIEDERGGAHSLTTDAFAGAEAGIHHWKHFTRNEDGNINGWTTGTDASLLAGAETGATFKQTSPGGWISASSSAGETIGFGGRAGYNLTANTDEISLALSGRLATFVGLRGMTEISVHPNAIAESMTDGLANLDDAIASPSWSHDETAQVLRFLYPF